MKKILVLVSVVTLLIAIVVGTILCTETGLLLLKKTANNLGTPFLTIGSVKGKLSGEWSLHKFELNLPSVAVSVDRVECHLRPAKLLEGELGLAELSVSGTKVMIRDKKVGDAPSDSPIVLPQLFLPFGFTIENITIEDLAIVGERGEEIFLVQRAGVHLRGKSHQLVLNSFFLETSDFDLTLHGSFDFGHDWNLALLGGYRFFGAGFENLSGTFSLNGPLNNPLVQLGLHQPAAIRAAGSITNLLEKPELKVTVHGENVVLSDLSKAWPEIHLTSAEIHLSGGIEGCHGDVLAEGNWSNLNNIRIASSMSSKWDGIDFQSLSLESEDGTVIAKESWISWIDTFSWGGNFLFENFNLEIFTKELPGRVNAEIDSQGKVGENGVDASFKIFELEGTLHQQQIAIQGNVFLTENEVYTDGLEVQSGEVQGQVFIQQGSFSWAEAFSWSGDIAFDNFDPSILVPELPGHVSGRIVGEGQLVEQMTEGALTIRDLSGSLRGQPLSGGGDIGFRNGSLKTEGISVQHGSSKVDIRGTAGEQFSLDLTLSAPDISQLIPMAEGMLFVEGQLTGTMQDPELQLVLEAKELLYGEHRVTTLKGHFQGQPRPGGRFDGTLQSGGVIISGTALSGGNIEIAGSIEEHDISLQVSAGYGELQMQAIGGYSNKIWEGSLQGIALLPGDYGRWEQINSASLVAGVDGLKLAGLCLTDDEGKVCLDGELNTAGEDIYWRIKSLLSAGALNWLNKLQLFSVPVSGIVNGLLEAEGDSKEVLTAKVQLDLPETNFEVDESGEELHQILLDDTRFTGSLNDSRFQGEVYTSMPNGSSLRISADIDNLGKFPVIPENLSLTGEVDIKKVDIAFLAPLTGYLIEPTGKINGSFSLSGTVNQPRANGQMNIADGGISLSNQGVVLEDIQLTLATEENGARLRCEASSGQGMLVASGKVVYAEEGILGDIGIKGENFMLLNLPEYEITIAPDLRLIFSKEKGELSGTVKIPTARITPEEMTSSVGVSDDVIFVNGGEEVKETAWPFYTRMDVQLGEDVVIDGYGLKGRLTGGLKLQDDPNSFLTGTGELDFIDSTFTIFGRSFDIERGRVLFTGGPIDNPGVDARAQKKVSDEKAKGDGYVVGVDVNGLVKNLQFRLFSSPFMEDTEILSRLLLGRSLADSSEEDNTLLGSAVNALGLEGGSRVFRGVGGLLPVDDVHIEGSHEDEDVSLVVGKRITKDLYFGYDINMFSQLGVFRVRYDLARGFAIETQTSTESTGTDILYTFEK